MVDFRPPELAHDEEALSLDPRGAFQVVEVAFPCPVDLAKRVVEHRAYDRRGFLLSVLSGPDPLPDELALVGKKVKRPCGEGHVGSVVLLRRRGEHVETFLGKNRDWGKDSLWLYPGGHEDEGETPLETALRETGEETGVRLTSDQVVPVGVIHGERSRDKDDHVFAAEVPEEERVRSSSDLLDGRWFEVEDLPEIAFAGRPMIFRAVSRVYASIADLPRDPHRAEKVGMALDSMHLRPRRKGEGILIALEGIDGAGKTSLCEALASWLEERGLEVVRTRWASDPATSKLIRRAKDRGTTPDLYSLLHAEDLAARSRDLVEPALAAGKVVLADRWAHTSAVRDTIRGADPSILARTLRGLREPDVLLHAVVPPDVAFERLADGKGLTKYGAGLDVGYAPEREVAAARYLADQASLYGAVLPSCPGYLRVSTRGAIQAVATRSQTMLGERLGI
jgi:dTMP kinase